METMRPGAAEAATATIHAPQAGHLAPPPTPGPVQSGDEQLAGLLGTDPDSCPEALRYMAMTRGTLESSHAVFRELEYRLAHVLAPEGELGVEPALPPCSTALGSYAAALYDDANRLERRLRTLLGRVRGV